MYVEAGGGGQLMRRRSVGWRQPMGCLYSSPAFLRVLILGGGRPFDLWVEAGGGGP